MEGGLVWRYRNGPAHKFDSPVWISPLESDQTEEVEGLGMIGLLRQGRLIEPRSLIEPALPVVIDRRTQVDTHRSGTSREVMEVIPVHPTLPHRGSPRKGLKPAGSTSAGGKPLAKGRGEPLSSDWLIRGGASADQHSHTSLLARRSWSDGNPARLNSGSHCFR